MGDRYDYPYHLQVDAPVEGAKGGTNTQKEVVRTPLPYKQGESKHTTPTDIEKQLRRLESELKVAQQIPMGSSHVSFREQRILKKQKHTGQGFLGESPTVHAHPNTSGVLGTSPLSPKSYTYEHIPLPSKAERCLLNRDFMGGLVHLKFLSNECIHEIEKKQYYPWIGYFEFHVGNFEAALKVYEDLEQSLSSQRPPHNYVNIALCHFHLKQYDKAEAIVIRHNETLAKYVKHKRRGIVDDKREPTDREVDRICNRILFHIAFHMNDDKKLVDYHELLDKDNAFDQLSLAAMHFFRGHYQEAAAIYKKILIGNRDFVAVNVYLALCYYKLEYYDVGMELVDAYLQHFPRSPFAINLKACCTFCMYNGRLAKQLLEKDLLRDQKTQGMVYSEYDLIGNNIAVFSNGDNALKIWKPLSGQLKESLLNLILFYVKNNQVDKAVDTVAEISDSAVNPVEYIIKATVFATYAQAVKHRNFGNKGNSPTRKSGMDAKKFFGDATKLFTAVGGSASECM